MTKAVEVVDLNVDIEKESILSHVTFDIEEGDFATIIGPNGAGKTTLLKAILGLVPIKSGEIRIFGKSISDAREFCGYVPQRFEFDRTFPLTVEEFLSFSLWNDTKGDRIEKVLEMVDMGGHCRKLMGNLSGGQLQRILIARAMINYPRILFMDEPVGGIDIAGRNAFYQMLLSMKKSMDITIVMVSHEVDVVYKFSNRVICISRTLHCHGHPHDKLTPQLIRSLYGDSVTLFEHRE
ncbi:MAG: metal ABC transporter ATP-binding protein [Synergistetes bacterium]|nr:metal ABC transporter ATP-binding protein [Synergistota bacterium]